MTSVQVRAQVPSDAIKRQFCLINPLDSSDERLIPDWYQKLGRFSSSRHSALSSPAKTRSPFMWSEWHSRPALWFTEGSAIWRPLWVREFRGKKSPCSVLPIAKIIPEWEFNECHFSPFRCFVRLKRAGTRRLWLRNVPKALNKSCLSSTTVRREREGYALF